jgi:hypothetical protein
MKSRCGGREVQQARHPCLAAICQLGSLHVLGPDICRVFALTVLRCSFAHIAMLTQYCSVATIGSAKGGDLLSQAGISR